MRKRKNNSCDSTQNSECQVAAHEPPPIRYEKAVCEALCHEGSASVRRTSCSGSAGHHGSAASAVNNSAAPFGRANAVPAAPRTAEAALPRGAAQTGAPSRELSRTRAPPEHGSAHSWDRDTLKTSASGLLMRAATLLSL